MRLTVTRTIVSLATAPVARHLWKFSAMSKDMITVSGLARTMGMDDAWVAKWGSAIGRKVAKAYRTATGEEPRKAWELGTRGLKRHMAYRTGEYPRLMAGVILDYMIKSGVCLDFNDTEAA